MTWAPHVTVAVVVEDLGRFLFVEEHTEEGVRINQPAGHLDPGESLIEAAVREALEETAHRVTVDSLVGVYQWDGGNRTYLRFAFAARSVGFDAARTLDTGIIRALWMTPGDLDACRERHRSPLVQQCMNDYLSGRRFPLDVLHHLCVAGTNP